LFQARLVRSTSLPVKVLGDGEIRHALTVKVNKISAAAEAKIIAAGGKVQKIL